METADLLLVVVTTVALLGPFIIVFRAFSVEEQYRLATPLGLAFFWLVLLFWSFSFWVS